MRKFLFLATCLVTMVSVSAQDKVDDRISFAKLSHAFGKVPKGKPVTVEFTFVNPSKKTLIIEDATAECGCTKPEFPQQPVAPGKSASIKVTYDAKEAGNFTKKVTVRLVNVAEPKVLTITGEVI